MEERIEDYEIGKSFIYVNIFDSSNASFENDEHILMDIVKSDNNIDGYKKDENVYIQRVFVYPEPDDHLSPIELDFILVWVKKESGTYKRYYREERLKQLLGWIIE